MADEDSDERLIRIIEIVASIALAFATLLLAILDALGDQNDADEQGNR